MKTFILLGIALIVIGAAILVDRGFSYTERKKVLDIGPVEATTTQNKTIPIAPVFGILSCVGGLVLVVAGGMSKKS
jgi:hypothetical protein